MDAPKRFERVTDETEHRAWEGHGSWPDSPYQGLSAFDKFFFIEPGPRRIVQEYSYNRHASDDICPRCGKTYYTHGMLTETFYQGLSNIHMRPTVCIGDTIVKFDDQNYVVTDRFHVHMTSEDWADLCRWKLWLFWQSIISPYRQLYRLIKRK